LDGSDSMGRPAGRTVHRRSLMYAQRMCDVLDTRLGPDGGNLACCWAVNQIVLLASGHMLSATNYTGFLGAHLFAFYRQRFLEHEVQPGGLIICPAGSGTTTRLYGHIGILGEGYGADRPIYSTISKPPRWYQSYTLETWLERYYGKYSLDTLFYPIPSRELR
jgi:hypothetical protein